MIGCSVQGYTRACSVVTGGVDILLVGDANDFTFTAGAAGTDGSATGYSAVALRTGATAEDGAMLYEIQSLEETIGVDLTQSNSDGITSAWEYAITARMAQMSQQLTNFNTKIDGAAACCQLLFIWRNADGKIFVAGEKYVANTRITKFKLRQDGSKISTGKKFSEFNGQDLSIKGSYYRGPHEFTGAFSVIQALMPE